MIDSENGIGMFLTHFRMEKASGLLFLKFPLLNLFLASIFSYPLTKAADENEQLFNIYGQRPWVEERRYLESDTSTEG